MQSRTMMWIGVGVGAAGLAAALAFLVYRLASNETREDPTTQRIQHLIDEANSLLRALDEQRHSA
jgi:membrane protein implicated in regulation of membrane protease activity